MALNTTCVEHKDHGTVTVNFLFNLEEFLSSMIFFLLYTFFVKPVCCLYLDILSVLAQIIYFVFWLEAFSL